MNTTTLKKLAFPVLFPSILLTLLILALLPSLASSVSNILMVFFSSLLGPLTYFVLEVGNTTNSESLSLIMGLLSLALLSLLIVLFKNKKVRLTTKLAIAAWLTTGAFLIFVRITAGI